MPTLEKLAESKQSYQLRAVLLHGCAELGTYLRGTGILEGNLLPKAIEMCSDRVPNLRLLAAQALGKLGAPDGGLLEPSFVSSHLRPALEGLRDDADVDVATCAKEALDGL